MRTFATPSQLRLSRYWFAGAFLLATAGCSSKSPVPGETNPTPTGAGGENTGPGGDVDASVPPPGSGGAGAGGGPVAAGGSGGTMTKPPENMGGAGGVPVDPDLPPLPPFKKKNVLLIMADDMNDWAQPFGGHPQAKTPNIAKLAQKGVVFNSAHAPVPVCQPSRTAMLTGLRPHDNGVFSNEQPHFRTLPGMADRVTLPQFFMKNGYRALNAGKIFHQEGPGADADSWTDYYRGPTGSAKGTPFDHGMTFAGNFALEMNWGASPGDTAQQGDWQSAGYIAAELEKAQDMPFFFAYGASKPHLAWHVPQKYFDMFPLESIQLPMVDENDLDDVPGNNLSNGNHLQFITPQSVTKQNWQRGVQAYLANLAFADECIGRVLDALERGPHKDNTIVLVMGDHGWHLGEKNHWGKATIWEEATRTPLIIYDPSINRPGVSNEPVSLQDLYPTLIELNGLTSPPMPLAGHSLVPLLVDPKNSKHVGWALSSWQNGSETLRTERWALIRHGAAGNYQYELYDMVADQPQHKNLATLPEHADRVKALSTEIDNIIKSNAPVSTAAFE